MGNALISILHPWSSVRYDNQKYGGFYTQKEIKDVVSYAQKRHVTIIPEIEMPGHALAALASYRKLGCAAGPFKTSKTWGVFDDVFCTKDSTFYFLESVLTEVAALFQDLIYISVGMNVLRPVGKNVLTVKQISPSTALQTKTNFNLGL